MPNVSKKLFKCEEDFELRRGPWTLEEDTLLTHYIARHGEGRWNVLAKYSGLKRTGKSCRLRWLNYLKPEVKRGNLTPEEQIIIIELHSKWGNRWSRIAQHLPGRTDNEIKNYWRTRIQKQARQLKVDANSLRFRDAIRCYWMPSLMQKIESSSSSFENQAYSTVITATQFPVQQELPSAKTLIEEDPIRSFVESCQNSSISNDFKETINLEPWEMAEIPELAELDHNGFEGYYVDTSYDTEVSNLGFTSPSVMNCCSTIENNWVSDVADNLWNMDLLWQL